MMTFEDYQTLAFLTARTEGLALLQVCLAILWQHSAELMRHTLPAVELKINKAIADRKVNDILGDIAWHVSALASLYKLRLSDIAEENQRKASQRWDEGAATPLHDEKFLREQFPRRFEIEIVTVANGRVRMYYNGRRLGDELTDNADQDDGYRFHDIMHLANVAFLGWSPVLRGLMKLKRKSDPKVDENQDGARATIVEEAIVKAIHSHGEHLYKLAGNEIGDRPRRLFSDRSFITFQFLKFIQNLARGLEVQDNKLWEWEKAIIYGHEIYYLLQCEGQGTVTVDLHQRSISFSPEVCPTFAGKVVGLGSATSDAEPISRQATVDTTTLAELSADKGAARQNAQKNAILNALGFQSLTPELVNALDIVEMGGGRISMKTRGLVQQAMWSRRAIGARTTLTVSASGCWHCTAVLLGDE